MSHSPQRPGVEMRHLRLVALIAEHGSLTSVARVLRISQPALSHQLRELETRLRAPLFERTARRMVLTPAGEQLNHIAQGVLAQIDAFERQVADGDLSIVHGTIRVATECYTAYHWLPGLLREFQKRWPNVELRVSPEHTASPVAALLAPYGPHPGYAAVAASRHGEEAARRDLDERIRVQLAIGHDFTPGDHMPLRPHGRYDESAREAGEQERSRHGGVRHSDQICDHGGSFPGKAGPTPRHGESM